MIFTFFRESSKAYLVSPRVPRRPGRVPISYAPFQPGALLSFTYKNYKTEMRKQLFTTQLNFVIDSFMKSVIGIKVDSRLREILQEQANEEHRALSNFILNAVLAYLKEKKGIEWKEPIR